MTPLNIRASKTLGAHRIVLTIECKGLSTTYPLLVSCVPHHREESFHEVLYTDKVQGAGGSFTRVSRNKGDRFLYREGEPVGKSMRQIRESIGAASLAASASSKAAWRSISASVVASTRAQSVRGSTGSQGPAERRRVTAPVASRRASVRAIPVPLPGVCLAGGDDPRRRFTPRVGDHE